MDVVFAMCEVLSGVAALATIADFVLDKREKYKRQRMAREKERAGCHRPS